MQLLLQRMYRRGSGGGGGGAPGGRFDRFRCLDHGSDDGGGGGGARRGDDIADRSRRQDTVDGEERSGGRHCSGGAARSRGDGLAVSMSRCLLRTDRTLGECPIVRDIGRLVAASRRDVILRVRRRVTVQIAVTVAGHTGTIVQRTRRFRHGRT